MLAEFFFYSHRVHRLSWFKQGALPELACHNYFSIRQLQNISPDRSARLAMQKIKRAIIPALAKQSHISDKAGRSPTGANLLFSRQARPLC